MKGTRKQSEEPNGIRISLSLRAQYLFSFKIFHTFPVFELIYLVCLVFLFISFFFFFLARKSISVNHYCKVIY